jgi:RNA recognition motif-containing protein
MSEDNLRKVFVGNVPFDCEQDEFESAFKNVKGYVKGEIVVEPPTGKCRGFGFITLDNIDHAEELKKRSDINIRDRQLRFTEYRTSNTKKLVDGDKNNLLFVDSLPDSATRDYLTDLFKGYSLGKHYVATNSDTGISKNNGLVEILDDSQYEELLMLGFINDKDNNRIDVSRWRSRSYKKRDKKVTKNDLYKAFNAGRNLGMIEGHRLARRQQQ